MKGQSPKEQIRPIRIQDKDRVLEISSHIWEGDDYLSYVFNDWIKEENGSFAGLWLDNILVAFGKMTVLSPGEIWLEGLRKDQNINIHGVGRILTIFMLEQLQKKNLKSIRFSTYFGNTESIIINEKLGFERIGIFSLKTLLIPEQMDTLYPLKFNCDHNFSEIESYLLNSEYYIKTGKLIPRGWVLHTYKSTYLQEMINNEKLLVFKENDLIKGMLIYDLINYKEILWISFIQAETKVIYKQLINEVIAVGSRFKKRKIQLILPAIPLLKEICRKAGFQSWEQDNDFLLYEFPVKKLQS